MSFPTKVNNGDPKPDPKAVKPTEAEYRALAAVETALQDRGLDHDVKGFDHADMLAIVRAVIRSLREPTAEMRNAIFGTHGTAFSSDDTVANNLIRKVIDAASPDHE